MSFIFLRRAGAGAFMLEAFRTYDALEAALLAESVGTLARLWGPTDPIAVFRTVAGPAVAIESHELDLTAADGSEFTQGTAGTDNIQRLSTANAGTWATPGANGGFILDGSGGLTFNFLGALSGAGALDVKAHVVPTVSVQADNQEYVAGWYSAAASAIFGGGVKRSAGLWYRQMFYSTYTAPVAGGATSANYEEKNGPQPAVITACQLAADVTTTRAGFMCGAYSGDFGTASNNQQVLSTTNVTLVNRTDNRLWLWANKAAGTLSVRYTKIIFGALS